jgi:hypothetical protein
MQSESENLHAGLEGDRGIDKQRISQLRARLRSEDLFHALLKNPEWLSSLAKTSDDLRSYQELLSQWQSAGCPDLESWLAKGSPAPLDQAPVKAVYNTPDS